MPPQIFKNKTIALAGPFPPSPNDSYDDLTAENVRRWTEARRGVFFAEMSHEVTHLLCTKAQFYGGGNNRVKLALSLGKTCHVVEPSWFRDSVFADRRAPERAYDLRLDKKRRDRRRREREKAERGRVEAADYVNTNLFTPYRDGTNFQYHIDLTRDNPEHGAPGQRHCITLWESHAKPPLYHFTSKYHGKRGALPQHHRPSPCQSPLDRELALFAAFFRRKTGVAWEDRVALAGTMGPEFFVYEPPTGGKPVGEGLRGSYDWCLEVNAQLRAQQKLEQEQQDSSRGDDDEDKGDDEDEDETGAVVADEDADCLEDEEAGDESEGVEGKEGSAGNEREDGHEVEYGVDDGEEGIDHQENTDEHEGEDDNGQLEDQDAGMPSSVSTPSIKVV